MPSVNVVDPPLVPNFRRRRTTFDVDLATVFDRPRNGLKLPVVQSLGLNRERRFIRWLGRVGGVGSRPEFMAYEALERRGYLSPTSDPPGLDFQFQVPLLGGRSRAGGSVADLVVYVVSPITVIRVQGEFFHFIDEPSRESDIIERLALESEGFRVIDILAQDLLTERSADEVVGAALIGAQKEFSGRLTVFA
jgi:hypothetical protein